MIKLFLGFLVVVVGFASAWLVYIQSPQREEMKKRKRKEAIDEAFREGDNETLAHLLSEHFGELRRKDKDNPRQQADNQLSDN